jgi:hypothetical protein
MSAYLHTIISAFTSSPMLASAAVGGGSIILIACLDYQHYCSLGDHGLPGNFYGWRRQLQMLKFARKDTTIPAPYRLEDIMNDYGPYATTSFLSKSLQTRDGNRPKIPGFVAPQRQVTEIASPAMKARMFTRLEALVHANGDLLQSELSRLEGPVPAIQLRPSLTLPPFLERTRGEIIHIHPPDGSTHAVLSLEDSRIVIEKGWGQRHRLSGGVMLPWNYILIYAPRNEAEFGIWKDIVEAVARFCCAEIGNIRQVKD